MSRVAIAFGIFLPLAAAPHVAAQAETEPRGARPARPANINVLLFGAGYPSFDHPQFKDDLFPNISYQRRIWRRESRRIPIWVRGAINFLSEDRNFFGYTVWQVSDQVPFQEDVQEHTSDFTMRGEMLADLLHGSTFAVYGGGGFGLHYLSFSSNGVTSQIPTFDTNESRIAPSAAVGARLFTARYTFTTYGEFRWSSVYGKTSAVVSQTEPWLTDQIFEFTRVDAWSFEAGAGVHW